MAEEVFDNRLPVADRAHLFERERHPAVEHSSSHRGNGLVEYIIERLAVVTLTVEKFEVADREPVEPHVLVGFQTAERMNMFGLQVLGYIQVVQYSCCGYYTVGHTAYAEAFEVCCLKLLA